MKAVRSNLRPTHTLSSTIIYATCLVDLSNSLSIPHQSSVDPKMPSSSSSPLDSEESGSNPTKRRLSAEVAKLWHRKPRSEAESLPGTNNLADGGEPIESLLLQLLVSQAVMDTREFKMLSYEELNELKEVRCCMSFAVISGLIYLIFVHLLAIETSSHRGACLVPTIQIFTAEACA